MWATTLTLHMLGTMVGEVPPEVLSVHSVVISVDGVEIIVLQSWNGRRHAQNWSHNYRDIQPISTAHLLKASLCVSARNPLNAVTGLLKPVSGGCTGQWSCCEMPAPLEKQINKQKTLTKQTKKSIQRFFFITRFAGFQKACTYGHPYRRSRRIGLCPFLLWTPQSSPVGKSGFGSICRLKGLTDHCSNITKGNARSFIFSQAGRSLQAIIRDTVRMWLLDAACAHLLRSYLTPTTVLEAQHWPARPCSQHSVDYLWPLPSRLIYFCIFLLCVM